MTSLSQMKEQILKCFKSHAETFDANNTLIEIYDGKLLKYVLQALHDQLSPKTFESARHRVAPINLLKKIIQKLSPIYNPAPARRLVDGNEKDKELFDWYVERINPNKFFWKAVRYYSMCRSALLDVVPDPKTKLPVPRVILNDRFFVMSTDEVDPMKPTVIVTFEKQKIGDKELWVFYCYTDEEFLIFDEELNTRVDEMNSLENPDGVNIYGVLPQTYATESESKIFPEPDSDMIAMTKLIPVILSDLNYAIMFQCFSIFYGINLDDKELKIGPNVLWRLKKDNTATGEPEVGVIKANVDYDGVMSTVQSELAMWLNSKGIRPGAIGSLDAENFANGISKMIDEMDTFELRQMLIDTFTIVESEFWEKLLQKQHPEWVDRKLIEQTAKFSPECYVETVFNTQQPMYSRGELVKDLALEVKEGFTTRKRAIAKLNPLFTEDEVDELMAEVEEERQTGDNKDNQEDDASGKASGDKPLPKPEGDKSA